MLSPEEKFFPLLFVLKWNPFFLVSYREREKAEKFAIHLVHCVLKLNV